MLCFVCPLCCLSGSLSFGCCGWCFVVGAFSFVFSFSFPGRLLVAVVLVSFRFFSFNKDSFLLFVKGAGLMSYLCFEFVVVIVGWVFCAYK